MYKQVVAFNQSLGGSIAGACLQNVRKGYGIPAKYPNAITSWRHAEQHADRNIPSGVDVPLYYSYLVDGHINVGLANGQVWSDGNLYSSVDDYLSKHPLVHYLGWGESVNDVPVIKEGDEPMLNDGDTTNFYEHLLGHAPDQNTLNNRRGTSATQLFQDIIQSDEYKLKQGVKPKVLAPGIYQVN